MSPPTSISARSHGRTHAFEGDSMLRLCHLAVYASLGTSYACIAAGLPDTGQDTCYTDTAPDPRPPSNLASVARDTGAYPRQDCRYGRDPAANGGVAKTGAGAKGFDYTKITGLGTYADPSLPLGPNYVDWACTLDQATGLMWEVKTGGASDLRYLNHTYTWLSSDFTTNGGNAGNAGTNTCNSTLGSQCNTEAYVAAVNAAFLCLYSDWRLPTRRELLTLIHIQTPAPAVDETYFINTASSLYWTASSLPSNPPKAVFVDFLNGSTNVSDKTSSLRVRLVRGPAY